jgi:serine/threonine-protein kinase
VRDLVSLQAGQTETQPIAAEPYDEKGMALSPDGKWIAYESTETGRDEIYVRPFPNAEDDKWQVSTSGATNPKWAHNGRELFFVNDAGEMVAAGVTMVAGTFEVTDRRPLFNVSQRGPDTGPNYTSWDVDIDDQSFLMVQFGGGQEAVANEFILVQNWIEEIRAWVGN